jgi:putative (di)nucleoside polyphosphate hydrolase
MQISKESFVAAVIDKDGFRANVGIIICNDRNQLFLGRRVGQNAWQFPQGGINRFETPREAMFRELHEEVGLEPHHVQILGCTGRWLRYRLPERYIRKHSKPLCIGQKQRWFLLRVNCDEGTFCFDKGDKPEFDDWRWVSYWQPVKEVIYFKRHVYQRALKELEPLLFPERRKQRQRFRPKRRSQAGSASGRRAHKRTPTSNTQG